MTDKHATVESETFLRSVFADLAHSIHANAVNKGFWDSDNDGEKICLMHSELGEMTEAVRKGNPRSEKIPEYSEAEEEGADTIIRIADWFAAKGFDLGGAIAAKMAYNKNRPYMHGGKKF